MEGAGPPESLISLAINPANPDELLASGRHTSIGSTYGGVSRQTIAGEPGLVSWPNQRSCSRSRKTAGWARQRNGSECNFRGSTVSAPAAFEAAGPEELYAALHDGFDHSIEDGGAVQA